MEGLDKIESPAEYITAVTKSLPYAYLFVWEPSQLPSESFVLPHWHLPLLLDLNSIIMFFRFVEVVRDDKFIVLIFIKFKKIKVVK